jgi:phage shock protein PspC (stress-responsive transcriptional regulator)
VCAAIARRLGIEPKVVRIIAVGSVIALGGLGAALYLAGILLLPRDSEQVSPLGRALPFTQRWPRWTVVLVVVGLLVALNWGTGAGPVLVPVAIVGLVIWATTRGRGSVRAASPEPTPFERAASAWRVRLAEQQVPGFEVAAQQQWQQPYTDPSDRLVSDSPALPPAVPVRRRSWRLWGLALALVGVFSLAVAVASTVFGLPGTPVAYASAVLAALGTTALVATRAGRPPLLIPATVITALVLGGLIVSPQVTTHGKVGDFKASYTNVDQLPPTIDVALGDADVDLSGLTLTGSRTLNINVSAGDLRLRLPAAATTEVDWHVSAGDVTLDGLPQSQTGIGSTGGMSTGSSTGGGLRGRGAGPPARRARALVDVGAHRPAHRGIPGAGRPDRDRGGDAAADPPQNLNFNQRKEQP